MKNRIVFFILLFLIGVLCCCGNKAQILDNTEYDRTCEVQNKYIVLPNVGFCVQEVGNSYIGTASLVGMKLLYYDSENKVFGVLCSDPSCTHDSNFCSARVNRGALSLYNNKIYTIAQDSESRTGNYILWREDLSGNNRKKVREIELTGIVFEYQPQQYFLHHGKLYMLGFAETVEGAKPEYRISLLSIPIDDNNDYQILVDERVHTAVWSMARFVGNYVYFMKNEYMPDESLSSITVMRFSTVDGKEETVYKETIKKESFSSFWVTNNGEIYIAGKGEKGRPCVWKINENKRKAAVSWGKNIDTFFYLADGIVVCQYYINETRYLSIKDLENNTLYEGPLFFKLPEGVEEDVGTTGVAFSMVGGDREKIIINLHRFDNGKKEYTILLDINNDLEPTLLWSSELRWG